MSKRVDQSFHLVHFTKGVNSLENLINILRERRIRARKPPHTEGEAVCFTECPWPSFVRHSEDYSAYGVGFGKSYIASEGGAPAVYLRWDLCELQELPKSIQPFVTPFWPYCLSKDTERRQPFAGKPRDFTHEREWRTSGDLTFDLTNLSFVTVATKEDIGRIPNEIREKIGTERILPMDQLRRLSEEGIDLVSSSLSASPLGKQIANLWPNFASESDDWF